MKYNREAALGFSDAEIKKILSKDQLKCGSCTYCCKNTVIPVDPNEEHLKTKQHLNLTVLQTKDNGDCIYLENGCSIYSMRPEVCRIYNCIGFYTIAKKRNYESVLNDKPFMKAVTRAIKRNENN